MSDATLVGPAFTILGMQYECGCHIRLDESTGEWLWLVRCERHKDDIVSRFDSQWQKPS